MLAKFHLNTVESSAMPLLWFHLGKIVLGA